MAKKQNEDFNLDDWSFDDEFDFGDFEAEPGIVKNDRNAVTKIAYGAIKGAKDTALDPNTLKEVIKGTIPKKYGKATTLVESGLGLGRNLYNDVEKEMRPAIRETKRFTKKMMPAMRGFMPESLAKKLDAVLDEKERSSGPTKEELMEATVSNTLTDIFKAQAEVEDKKAQEQAVKEETRDAIESQRFQQSISLFNKMHANIARLAQYQDKVTVNYQRKILELQMRSYFLQQEQYEEQKKINAIIQTNLEGILKNTGLPEHAKITLLERTTGDLLSKKISGVTDGLLGKGDGFLANFSRQVRSRVKNAAREKAASLRDMFDMGEMLQETLAMAEDTGMSRTEMAGSSAGSWLARKMIKPIQRRLANKMSSSTKQRLARTAYAGENIENILKEMADEGVWENIPILGSLMNVIYSASQDTRARNNSLNTAASLKATDPAIFDNKVYRSITDVIPNYLAHILQATQDTSLLLRYQASGKKAKGKLPTTPDLQIWDWSNNRMMGLKELQSRLSGILNDTKDTDALNNDYDYVVDALVEQAKDRAESGGKNAKQYDQSVLDAVKRGLINAQISGRSMDVKNYYNEDWWRAAGITNAATLDAINAFVVDTFGDYRNQTGGSLADKFKETGRSNGLDYSAAIKALQRTNRAGSNYRNKTALIRDLATDYSQVQNLLQNMQIMDSDGTLKNLARIRDGVGTIDEQLLIRSQTKGFSNRYTRDVDGSLINPNKQYHEAAARILEKLDTLFPDGENLDWNGNRSADMRRLLGELKKASIKHSDPAYADYLDKYGLEDRFDDKGVYQARGSGSNANGGVVGYYANGGRAKRSYTGKGSKWQEADYKVHAGEIVWSQDDIKRMGGVQNVELLRNGGYSSLNAIQMPNGKYAYSNNTGTVRGGVDTQTYQEVMLEKAGKIVDILEKGIPVSGIVSGDKEQDIPWYLRSFGSVIGDIAAMPFKLANGLYKKTKLSYLKTKRKITRAFSKGWDAITKAAGTAKGSMLSLKDKMSDKFDIFVEGEVKPRLTAAMLRIGNYYDEKGNQITSWSQITTGGVYTKDEDGNLQQVLTTEELSKAFAYNYEVGKATLLKGITKLVDWTKAGIGKVFDTGSAIQRQITSTINWATKTAVSTAKSFINRPIDIYVKDKIAEGPRILAMLMKKGYYYSKKTGEVINAFNEIDGEVVDKDGNIVLSIEDMKAGLVDANNKPLNRSIIDKALSWLGKPIGLAVKAGKFITKTATGLGRMIKDGASSLFGGVKNFFAQFFGDGGVIFANSNKLVDKLDAIYKLLDWRLPGEGNGQGISSKNRLSALKKKEQEIKEKLEAEARAKAGIGDGKPKKLSKFAKAMAKKLGFNLGGDDEDEEDSDEKGWLERAKDRYDDWRDSREERRGRGGRSSRRGRMGRMRTRARAGARRVRSGMRNVGRGLRGRLPRLPSMGGGFRMPRMPGGGLGLGGLTKGVGVGMGLSMLAGAANATGHETIGTMLDMAGNATTLISAARFAMPLISSAAPAVGSALATAGTALSSGLMATGTFLLTNPIGWGILAAGAIAAAGYGIYKFFSSRKNLGPVGKYRMAQYGFKYDDKKAAQKMSDLEALFDDKVTFMPDGNAVLDDKIEVKKFFDALDVDMENKEAAQKALTWFAERFSPVYLQHRKAVNKLNTKEKFTEVEDKLTAKQKLQWIKAARFQDGPYNFPDSPIEEYTQLLGKDNVEQAYNDLVPELEKAAAKEGNSEAGTATAAVATATATATAAASATTALTNDKSAKDATSNAASASMVPATTAAAAVSTKMANAGNVTTITSTGTVQQVDVSKITELGAIRMFAYGLNELDSSKVSALLSLEKAMIGYTQIVSGSDVAFNGDLDEIADKYAVLFGIDTQYEEDKQMFVDYLQYRFLPVLIEYLSASVKITNKLNIETAADDNMRADDAVIVAQAIIAAVGGKGAVWSIEFGLWDYYKLNTSVKSVEGYLEVIKKNVQNKALLAPTADKAIEEIAKARPELDKTNRNRAQQAAANQAKATQAQQRTGFFDGLRDTVSNVGGFLKDTAKSAGNWMGNAANSVSNFFGGGPVYDNAGASPLVDLTPSGGGNLTYPGSGGTIENVPQSKGVGWAANRETILAAAKIVGVDPGMMGGMAAQESGLDPNARAKGAGQTATGLFQFTAPTWRGVMQKYANKYKIPANTPPTNGAANALLGAQFIKDNLESLKGLGATTPADAYLAHFLGFGGARKMLKMDQNAPAAPAFPREAPGNRTIFYKPNGQPRTAAEIRAWLYQAMVQKHKSFGVDVPIGSGPNTVGAGGQTPGAKNTPTAPGFDADAEYNKKMMGIAQSRKAVMENKNLTAEQKKAALKQYDDVAAKMSADYAGYKKSRQILGQSSVAKRGLINNVPSGNTASGSMSSSNPYLAQANQYSGYKGQAGTGTDEVGPDSGRDAGASSSNSLPAGSPPPNHRAVKAARYARSKAHPKSQGLCARYVVNALQAAGYKMSRGNAATLAPGPISAAGFKQIPNNAKQMVGDVKVWEAVPSAGAKYGHICIWDGQNWVSDFIQRSAFVRAIYRTSPHSTWRDATLINGKIEMGNSDTMGTGVDAEKGATVTPNGGTGSTNSLPSLSAGTSTQTDAWAAVRKGNTVSSGSINDFQGTSAFDSYQNIQRAITGEKTSAEMEKENERSVAYRSLKELEMHTQLLTDISSTLKEKLGKITSMNNATVMPNVDDVRKEADSKPTLKDIYKSTVAAPLQPSGNSLRVAKTAIK